MTEINSLHLLLLLELLGLLSVVCVAMVVALLIRSRRERRAIDRLVALVKEDSNRRQEETRSLLEKRFGYQGEASTKIARNLSRKELGFYQTLINLFIKRDVKTMEGLNIVFEDAVAPYRELDVLKNTPAQEAVNVIERRVSSPDSEEEDDSMEASPVAGLEVASPAAEDDDGELQRLRIENQQLLEELQLTMNTMGGMLGQYASMFENDVSAGAEAMAQMQDEEEDSTSGGDEVSGSPEVAASQAASGAEGEPAEKEGLVDDLEPNWDEALTEQLVPGSAGEAAAEVSADEPEPNWDEALTEQLDQGSADEPEPNWDEALTEQLDQGSADEPEPNWDEALTEQLDQGSADEPEPNWDEALNEQLEQGQDEPTSSEQEPSWDEALVEQKQDGQAGKG